MSLDLAFLVEELGTNVIRALFGFGLVAGGWFLRKIGIGKRKNEAQGKVKESNGKLMVPVEQAEEIRKAASSIEHSVDQTVNLFQNLKTRDKIGNFTVVYGSHKASVQQNSLNGKFDVEVEPFSHSFILSRENLVSVPSAENSIEDVPVRK